MRTWRFFVTTALVVLAGCSFSPNGVTSDGSNDAPVGSDAPMGSDVLPPSPVTLSFNATTQMVDHTAHTIHVEVDCIGTPATPVSVVPHVSGGDAVSGTDFNYSEVPLIFNAEGPQSANIDILAIAGNTGVKHIALTLENPSDGAIIGSPSTTSIDIQPNVLPRISFDAASESVDEGNTTVNVAVSLDIPTPADVVAQFTVGGTATSPDDFTVATASVTIPANTLHATIPVQIKQDTLDENDETVVLTLTSATFAEVSDVTPAHTITITDNDDPPDISFDTTTSQGGEGTTAVQLGVSLSAPSGLPITVDFAADPASTASDPGDYSYNAAIKTLTFAPGETTKTIDITVVQDTNDEDDETIVTVLSNAANANIVGGTNTYTIGDDDIACFGPADNFQVCYDRGPSATVTLGATLDTDTDPACQATQALNWTTTQGQPAACFILGTDINIATTTVTGSRPLVLVASGTLTITTLLDGASHVAGGTGPGLPATAALNTGCTAFGGTVQDSTGAGGGGGAGGSFMAKGGDGGTGDNVNRSAGTAPGADTAVPTTLRVGCDGQVGGAQSAGAGGTAGANAGRAGGVLYLIADTLSVNTAKINASGAGGAAGVKETGGSGGGSGGMIKLFFTTIVANANSQVFANGGGGASGTTKTAAGAAGVDASLTSANGGNANGVAGGHGFFGTTPATDGVDGPSNKSGAGGGGGGGYIVSNQALGAAKVSAGKKDTP